MCVCVCVHVCVCVFVCVCLGVCVCLLIHISHFTKDPCPHFHKRFRSIQSSVASTSCAKRREASSSKKQKNSSDATTTNDYATTTTTSRRVKGIICMCGMRFATKWLVAEASYAPNEWIRYSSNIRSWGRWEEGGVGR